MTGSVVRNCLLFPQALFECTIVSTGGGGCNFGNRFLTQRVRNRFGIGSFGTKLNINTFFTLFNHTNAFPCKVILPRFLASAVAAVPVPAAGVVVVAAARVFANVIIIVFFDREKCFV